MSPASGSATPIASEPALYRRWPPIGVKSADRRGVRVLATGVKINPLCDERILLKAVTNIKLLCWKVPHLPSGATYIFAADLTQLMEEEVIQLSAE